MGAEKTVWDQNRREDLGRVLPLTTPLSLNIEASRACNIKCVYCLHSLSKDKLSGMGFKPQIMDPDVYGKVINGCKSFEKKIKTIRFAGYGEPLVNRHLAQMVADTKQSDICEQIVVFTNAVLLTPDLSESLIDAGVDTFRIAIQGLSVQAYQKNAGVKIDYVQLLDNLKHLYKIKQNARIFIKAMDFAVKNQVDTFYNMFGDFCDEIAVENVTQASSEVDYTDIIQTKNKLIVTGEHERTKIHVCPYPFYMMTINADGNVSACCKAVNKIFFVGNVKNDSLVSIWNNRDMTKFRKFQLKHSRFKHAVCKACDLDAAVPLSDIIDEQADTLLEAYPMDKRQV